MHYVQCNRTWKHQNTFVDSELAHRCKTYSLDLQNVTVLAVFLLILYYRLQVSTLPKVSTNRLTLCVWTRVPFLEDLRATSSAGNTKDFPRLHLGLPLKASVTALQERFCGLLLKRFGFHCGIPSSSFRKFGKVEWGKEEEVKAAKNVNVPLSLLKLYSPKLSLNRPCSLQRRRPDEMRSVTLRFTMWIARSPQAKYQAPLQQDGCSCIVIKVAGERWTCSLFSLDFLTMVPGDTLRDLRPLV